LKAASIVNEAVEDGVAEGGIPDDIVPMFDGDLAGDDGRGATMAIIKDLQKVAPFGRIECLSKIILFGERSLRRALSEYVEHYYAERNHQGKSNVLLFPRGTETRRGGPVQCRSDWAGSCVITIKRLRKLAGKSRTMPVRLAAELHLRNDDYDCWQTHERVTCPYWKLNPAVLMAQTSEVWDRRDATTA
jgi:hypothetical protein